jgi:hypothetical protein
MPDGANPLYEVLTWDSELGDFTPQEGLPPGPFTRAGLRGALRSLRDMGYDVNRRDAHSVLVRRLGGEDAGDE